MPTSYPKKYWWVVLVVVPIALGLVAILPKFLGNSGGKGDSITVTGSNVGGNVQIIGTQVIFNQLEKSTGNLADLEDLKANISRAVNLVEGGFYNDAIVIFEDVAKKAPSAAIYNNLGTLYLLENRDSQAREAFKEGIAVDPAYQPLRLNLASLYEKEGKITEAIDQLKKAPDEPEAETRLAKLQEKAADGLIEQEPNDNILGPNDTPLSENILGAIKDESDIDFFKFRTPAPPRDRIRVGVKNFATNMKLRVQLWGPDKSHFWSNASYGHQVTAGQDIQYAFSPLPETAYYLSVSSLGGQGKYQLSLSPQKAFDSYEPNDNILAARDVESVNPVEGSLMDQDDQDYYRIRSSGNAISISLKNRSSNLKPQLQLWHGNKSHLWTSASYGHQVTAGQDLVTSFKTTAGEIYYISIASLGGYGKYTMVLTQSQ